MSYDHLRTEVSGHALLITIDRPPVNALSLEVLKELDSAFEEASDDNVRCVIITGAGKAFIAGADIKGFAEHGHESGPHPAIRVGNDLFNSIEVYPKPVIAAVNGVCLGGGNELAMACDFRIASTSAAFGQPEIKLGLMPGWGGLQRLPRLVGRAATLDISLTGRQVKPEEALSIGLVNEVVEPEELLPRAKELANTLSELPPLAVAHIKERLAQGLSERQGQAIRDDEWAFAELMQSEDGREGVGAFLEKRQPRWRGR